ncbi:primase-helicase family protein [Pseudomonas sp. YQ_13]|uniref:primase-helicase family protein n=1 Tax=Pseudomonas sp. YQ_13 TaxID=3367235 RepID=UPI00370CD3E0
MSTIASSTASCSGLPEINSTCATVGIQETSSDAVAQVLINGGSSKSITGTVVLPAFNDPTINPPPPAAHTSPLTALPHVEFGQGNAQRQVTAQQAQGAPQTDGGILLTPGAIRPPTPGEQALLDSMARANRANRDFKELSAEDEATHLKVSGLTPESWKALERISGEFVMYSAAKGFCAYERATGVEHCLEGFTQLVKQRHGDAKLADSEAQEPVQPLGKIWWFGSFYHKRVVSKIVMEPNELSSADDAEARRETLNLWHVYKRTMVEPNYNATGDDAAPFINHLLYLSDNDAVGVTYFLCWLAVLYQNPGTKIPSAILMYSEFGGVGKSMIWKLLVAVFGKPLVGSCSGKALTKNFDDVSANKRLLIVNEMTRSERTEWYEHFKNTVSEEEVSFEGKGKAAKDIVNVTHYLITTNHQDALPLMQNDRRIAVLMCTARPKPPTYYAELRAWFTGPGPAIVANLLRTWQFPADWNTHAPVPQTAAARAMQDAAQGDLHTLVKELIEDRLPPFDRDMIVIDDVVAQLKTLYASLKTQPNRTNLAEVLKKLCGEKEQLRIPGIGKTDNVRVYLVRNKDQWMKAASPAQRAEHMKTGARLFTVTNQSDESEVSSRE